MKKQFYKVWGTLTANKCPIMAALKKAEIFYFDEYGFARTQKDEFILYGDNSIRLNFYIERRIIEVNIEESPTLNENFKTCYNTMRLKHSFKEIMNIIHGLEQDLD